ncbi:MAG TPA: sugar phosphate nucleotidyltransferase [Actinomycetota bacterium]|nr:sugar phosphate nucleotidyltransferase [Actinomycetota bacterium]
MKGLVLAGGLGTRFHPVTKVVNKHLLDVFGEPMIYFPLRTLATAGVTEIVLVTGDEISQFKRLLGDGSSLGVRLEYAYQQDPEGGIADAIAKAESLIGGDRVMVVLGDNIFGDDLTPFVESFKAQDKGAKILLKRMGPEEARRFGVAVIEGGKVVRIVEKPAEPPSDLAQTGCYMYDDRVFGFIKTLSPSARGELEVTDLNNLYIEEGTMTYDVLSGWWTDAGTPLTKLRASILIAHERGIGTEELNPPYR